MKAIQRKQIQFEKNLLETAKSMKYTIEILVLDCTTRPVSRCGAPRPTGWRYSSYKRLKYVRYADDFLIGIIGNRADCVFIRDSIHDFLLKELKLNLNIKKTQITYARDEFAHFLCLRHRRGGLM